ncbi:hypothetical protein [Streptomyces similanensis]|uniref:hypothetical protein n=1 Tax=Streptomyces similanensis TaxID=1274988 RepID=UPI0031EF69C7
MDVLLHEPVPFDGAAAFVVLWALAEGDAVLLGKVGQHSAGEACEGGDLLERLVFVEVELSESLFRHGLPGLLPDAAGGSGGVLRQRGCGGWVFVEDMPDGLDGCVQDLSGVLNGVLAFSDELVQTRQVDVRRVGSGKGEPGQQGGGRLPSHGLVMDVVPGQECKGFLLEGVCELRGLKRGEVHGCRPELCAVEPTQFVGNSLGRQAAETLEELAVGDTFAPSGPRRCSGAAADLQPAVVGKQASVVQESAPAVVDGGCRRRRGGRQVGPRP